ncbi:MAG: HAMP domain-containing histidine kinase [Oscillospiraceae bacterium]|nr:HAMP domain-containing histidine kinase [Oscillospiraceae bacterium]
MKKILRNNITKAVAFLLIVACAAAFVPLVLDIGDRVINDVNAYTFEMDFEDSRSIWNAKSALMSTMYADEPYLTAKYLDNMEYARYSIIKDGIIGNANATPEEIQQLPYYIHWTKTTEKPEIVVDMWPNAVVYGDSPASETVTAVDTVPAETIRSVVCRPGAKDTAWNVFNLDPAAEVIRGTGNISFDVYVYNNGDYNSGYIALGPENGESCFKLDFSNDTIGAADGLGGYRSAYFEPDMVGHITINVDMASQTYSAWVNYETDNVGSYPTAIANNAAFDIHASDLSRITVQCENMSIENIVIDNGALVPAGPMEYIDRSRLQGVSMAAPGGEEYRSSYIDDDGNRIYTDKNATYSYSSSDGSYRVWHEVTNEWEGDYDVYLGISSEHYNDLLNGWTNSRTDILRTVYIAAALVLLALLLWIYLMFVCGRRPEDDEVHMMLIDKAPVEITAAVGLIAAVLLGVGSGAAVLEALSMRTLDILAALAILAAAAAMLVFIPTTQSLMRNLKNGTFFKRSLCLGAIKFVWKWGIVILKIIWRWAGKLYRGLKKGFFFICGNKLTIAIAALFSIYSFIIAIMFYGRISFLLVVFPIALYVLCRYLWELDKIKTGIFKIRSGDTEYKIEGCKTELLKNSADALNTINEGVKLSVEREVKAQRMKSELITNVSHDLKTPLTSIISYADLLADMELSPKEANDYAKIVKQKADRLKKLTQDLFDISKAESGNETLDIERLDIALLLRQSLGELNNEIEKSGLCFVTKIPDREVFVSADGKKLSRVFENLIINAVKYSMPGTRVYVDMKLLPGKVSVEIKNISAAPMNFDPSEITERFVRGDQSRTTEGSGLGLAIARSYTELCGGRLTIDVDGDLFKATVNLKTV